MDIEQECTDALKRLHARIEGSAKKHKKAIFNAAYPKIEAGIPSEKPQSSIVLSISTVEEFYKCVHWCNNRIGRGSHYWTVRGRVHRFICPTKPSYNPPAEKTWVCFVPGIDMTPLLAFLNKG